VTNLGFSLTYSLNPFWASINPLSWALLLEAAIAGIAIVVLTTRRATPVGVLVGPPQVISRFVELYDEKSSMRLESDKIEEDVARGAMNRFDYRRRRRTIDLRMNEIDRALVPIKEQLSSISPRYQDMIRRLERAEAELRAVRTTSIDIRNQYRSGRMSKDLYESLSGDLIRRRDRAQQSIDNIIITLREEIR
jgi:archaellum component FlaC